MPTQDEILHQKTLLATHRRTLAHYLKQQAALGEAFAPPAVAFGITETRDNIRRIKSILRGWNVQVDDHPDDGDEVQEPTPSEQAQTLPNTVDRTRMRRILTD
jgi:hypothetical protein